LGPESVYFGEASLSGAIRPVSHAAMRLREAQKLGFTAAAAPAVGDASEAGPGMKLTPLRHLSDLAVRFTDEASPRERKQMARG